MLKKEDGNIMKRKKLISLLLCATLVFSLIPLDAHAAGIWDGTVSQPILGMGSETDPYKIGTAEELAWFAQTVNSRDSSTTGLYAELTADIVLNDTTNLLNWGTQAPANTWTPIGIDPDGSDYHPYRGIFDGKGHTVSGIYINTTDNGKGLFGAIHFADIVNLGIKDSYIKGGQDVGGIVGSAVFSDIAFCYSEAYVIGQSNVGGLVGFVMASEYTDSAVSYSYNGGTIMGGVSSGGIAGFIDQYTRIVKSYNTGTVSGSVTSGGILGEGYGDVLGCYYLEGSAAQGSGTPTQKSLEAFTRGEVAYLLQDDNTNLYWGNTTLNGTEFPQLEVFNSALKQVYNVEFYNDANFLERIYVLKNNYVALPSELVRNHYVFEGWNTLQDGTGMDFTDSTAVIDDIKVYVQWSDFAGGDGSEASPYLIEIPEQLRFMADAVNNDNYIFGEKHYKLNADISLNAVWTIDDISSEGILSSGTPWTPIGTWHETDINLRTPFQGSFDGNNYTISNIFINNADDYQGLFGAVLGGTIKNLNIDNSYIKGNNYVGGIVGYVEGYYDGNSKIIGCHNAATVSGSPSIIGGVGGIAGRTTRIEIAMCTNRGEISGILQDGGDNIGGIAGWIYRGSLTDCMNSGAISGRHTIGGLAGAIDNCNSNDIKNVYNAGTVSGLSNIGGLVGRFNSTNYIKNSFNTGMITGNYFVGGIAGHVNAETTVTNSYFLQGSAVLGIGSGTGLAVIKTPEEFNNGEVCYLLQDGQVDLNWGHTILNDFELPQLKILNNAAERVIRVQFYNDADQNGAFELVSTEYTLSGGVVPFPSIQGNSTLSWIDNSNTEVTSGTTFVSDMDLYANFSQDSVESATLNPIIVNFDISSPKDVESIITWNDATTVNDIKHTGSSIGAQNYVVSGDALTIKSDYLEVQPTGSLMLTTVFDIGDPATLTITINHTTPSSISPSKVNYNLAGSDDISTIITWNNALSVTDVTYNLSSLILGTDYTVNGNTLTIAHSYLSGLSLSEGDILTFDIKFDNTDVTVLMVDVVNNYTPASDADLSDLQVGGVTVSGFDPSNLQYTVELPYGTLPGSASAMVSATAQHPFAQVNITQAAVLQGDAIVTVTAEDGTAKVYTVKLTIGKAPITTYTVTFNNNGMVYTTKVVNEGESIGGSNWPSNPTRTDYTFGGWFMGIDGFGTQLTSTSTINVDLTVYAKWTYNNGGGSSGGNSSGRSTPLTPVYKANVKTENGDDMTIQVVVNKDIGSAAIDISSQNLTLDGKTIITMPSIPDADMYSVGIPFTTLSTTDVQGTLTFDTDVGSITISSNMLTDMEDVDINKAIITIGKGDKSNLSDEVREVMGEKPLIKLTLDIDGKPTAWNNPDSPVTVFIPYTPTTAELDNPESIIVWYIDSSGNIVTISNGHYDSKSGMVTFSTTHFSNYAVAYNKVRYNDVAREAWYNEAVSFIGARGITDGTGNRNYSPEERLTRGEFITLIMRAYGIAPDENYTNNFDDAGNTYYTGYLATVKRLRISEGIGNNMYDPDKEITCQEMFTLLYNTLIVVGQLPEDSSNKMLSDFADADQISPWAKEAMTSMVKIGAVTGNNGKLTPLSTTTRADMAKVLYNLLSN